MLDLIAAPIQRQALRRTAPAPIIETEPPIGPGLDESASNPHILQMAIRVRLILVPLDFSKHADSVIEWAAHLAEEHQSSVVLLHAYHLPVEFQQVEGAYLPVDFWNSVKDEAKDQLSQYGERLRERGLPVEEITREGHPASVIEEEAERLGVDLIVIGSRGRSGLKHLLLGSIAERVVQKAPCPVLTVKSPQS
jgi:nucleotide-binding universal stress UspA family protein